MNQSQNPKKLAVILFLVIFVALILFPPWKYEFPSYSATRYAGHHFILRPPILKDYEEIFKMSGINIKPGYVRVYQSRLIFEILASAFISCSVYLFLRRKIIVAVLSVILGSLILAFSSYIFI
jgi:hypothetical protein